MELDELAKGMEEEYTWEDKPISETGSVKLEAPEIRIETLEELKRDDKPMVANDKRLSLEEDQFVDALTSPLEKPRDWTDFPSTKNG
jgi:hypothetical protein